MYTYTYSIIININTWNSYSFSCWQIISFFFFRYSLLLLSYYCIDSILSPSLPLSIYLSFYISFHIYIAIFYVKMYLTNDIQTASSYVEAHATIMLYDKFTVTFGFQFSSSDCRVQLIIKLLLFLLLLSLS